MKAVFDTKVDSIYDDDIAHRYHFPSRYLKIVSQCVGDWIVYRQPRAGGGSKAYFAAAQVDHVEEDKTTDGHFYAMMSGFLRFDQPVPWLQNGRYAESKLRNLDNVSQLGLYLRGRSVRPLEDSDFEDIVSQGLSETIDPSNAYRLNLDQRHLDPATSNLLSLPDEERARRVVEMLVNRRVRDASFRRSICEAYEDRCAVTGLRIINGRGRSEVQAAHILPVSEGGPDTVQNGIALSGTIHWLFDRHLISLDDEYRLLVSHNRIPSELRRLFDNQLNRIILPENMDLWPNQKYIERHRKEFAES